MPLPQILRSRFARGNLMTLAGLGTAAVGNALAQFYIARNFGAETLGAFNLALSLQLVAVQLAGFGLPLALTALGARHAAEPPVARALLVAALSMGLALAALAALAGLALTDTLAGWFTLDDFGAWWRPVAWSLVPAALVRIAAAQFNAERRMGWFAVVQGLRQLFLLAALVAVGLAAQPGWLPWAFLVGELATLLVVVAPLSRSLVGPRAPLGAWRRRQLAFGLRSLPTAMSLALCTRIDLIVLSLFAAPAVIGVYGLASAIGEALLLPLVVLRHNWNPILGRRLAEGATARLAEELRTARRRIMAWMLAPAALAPAAMAALVALGALPLAYAASVAPLAIMAAGAWLRSGAVPFMLIFAQGGRPGVQAAYFVAIPIASAMGTALLAPVWGAEGAALAQALASVAAGWALWPLARRTLGLPC